MHGNTKVKSFATTIRREALAGVRANLYRFPDPSDAAINYCDGARPGTIAHAVREYIDGLSDAAHRRFLAEVKKGYH